jgi:hypothetical protein
LVGPRWLVVGERLSTSSGGPPIVALGVDSTAAPRLDPFAERPDEGSAGTVESIVDESESGAPDVTGGIVESGVTTVEADPQFVQGAVTAPRVV